MCNSISTGIPLSCHMSHHGKSTKFDCYPLDHLGHHQFHQAKFWRYHPSWLPWIQWQWFKLSEDAEIHFLNTTKHRATLALIFGNNHYKSNRNRKTSLKIVCPLFICNSFCWQCISSIHGIWKLHGDGNFPSDQQPIIGIWKFGLYDFIPWYFLHKRLLQHSEA